MKRSSLLVAAAACVLIAAVAIYVNLGWQRFEGSINALEVDLRAPDAYVDTVSLSSLPRALVKAPVLRELLTEDFAFYYEEHEDRLGLRGAIKRIAFEHELTLADDLLDLALDAPAEIAFWADAKGAPRHWMIAMTRGVLAKALQGLGTIAAKDRQLTLIADVRLGGFSKLPVYALALSSRRTLAFVARGERVVVLSDPGLLFDAQRVADGRASEVIGALLSAEAEKASVLRRHFGIAKPAAGHRLVAGGRMLSFGYQHFFPTLEAVSAELSPDGAALQTRVRMAVPASAGNRALWSALPVNPAACALLPIDGMRLSAVLAEPEVKPQTAAWSALAGTIKGPAALCWYASSQLHTPLVVVRANAGAADAAKVEAFMHWWLPQQAEFGAAEVLPGGGGRWPASVEAPWAAAPVEAKGREEGAGDEAAGRYQLALAHQGDWWMFSPDAALVDAALEVAARRRPSVADTLPAEGSTLAVAAPAALSSLVQREALAVLGEPLGSFRQAAETLLFPRLAAFAKLPAARAVVAGAADDQRWVPVQWQALGHAR